MNEESTLSVRIAKHFRQVHYGGNWTGSNLTDVLSDVDFKEAITQIASLNTIAKLVFHVNYYVEAVNRVMRGKPLDAHDKFSYDLPELKTEDDWHSLRNKLFADAEILLEHIENIPEEKWMHPFGDGKYGTYHRNILGLIEHTHYHLGQIAIIKKMIREVSH